MASTRMLLLALAAALIEGCAAYYKDGVLVTMPTVETMRLAHSRQLLGGGGSNKDWLAAQAENTNITHGEAAAVVICITVAFTAICIGGTWWWDRKYAAEYQAIEAAEKEANAQAKKTNAV